jgi:hypothetical protein
VGERRRSAGPFQLLTLATAILEPIHKVVESEESVVIPSLAPESWVRGAECGKLNIAVLPTATACATPVI